MTRSGWALWEGLRARRRGEAGEREPKGSTSPGKCGPLSCIGYNEMPPREIGEPPGRGGGEQ